MVNVKEKYLALPSGKHSGRRSRTQMLTVHSAECPMERGWARSLTEGFLNILITAGGPEASINGFADPGVFVRAVNTYNASWHATWANPLSVGYETSAYAAFDRATWMSLEGRRMLERLAIEMAADAEIFDIPLRWLTGRQVNAIRAGNRTLKGLSAHRQIDPAHRTDPGDGFPYGYLLKRIKHHSGVRGHGGEVKPIEEEKEWYQMPLDNQAKDDIRDLLKEFLGDKFKVPGNQPTGPENETWQFDSVVTSVWRDSNAIREGVATIQAILEESVKKGTLTDADIARIKQGVKEVLKDSTVDVDINVQGRQA